MRRQRIAPEIVDRSETPLTVEAFRERMRVPPSDEEVEELADLVRWFTTRYPTAQERFAYIRRKYAEWTKNPPVDP